MSCLPTVTQFSFCFLTSTHSPRFSPVAPVSPSSFSALVRASTDSVAHTHACGRTHTTQHACRWVRRECTRRIFPRLAAKFGFQTHQLAFRDLFFVKYTVDTNACVCVCVHCVLLLVSALCCITASDAEAGPIAVDIAAHAVTSTLSALFT